MFEITIRGMGGLLSGHMFASDSAGRWGFGLPWYNNELLDLAYDLGKRLLPAFKTRTGIPYARVGQRFDELPPLVLTQMNKIRLTCAMGYPEERRLKLVSFSLIYIVGIVY